MHKAAFGWRSVVALGGAQQALYCRISNLTNFGWQQSAVGSCGLELSSFEQCELAIAAVASGCSAAGFRFNRGISTRECLKIEKLIAAWPHYSGNLAIEFDVGEVGDSSSVLFSALCSLRRLGVALVCSEFGLTAFSAHDLLALRIGAIRIAEPIVRLAGENGSCDRVLRGARLSASTFAPLVIATGVDEESMLERVVSIGFEFGEGDALAPMTISRPWKLTEAGLTASVQDAKPRVLQ
ncbi:hypothetical protein IP81_01695 [Novosphingobium sp. AAP83]|uniref:EAL domain-containing protein n=1 Tax=Novosphingobium sp. AAP83 TaxID=1523425 RepID=UPI0006B987DA|nr:EAL domain-containing protein [Novosphingobium sp. AAP83]KPF93874.1 hypothetical protein IP81_01695 [Novosphingobium sp. AAP83]